ncbi:hypothetical protein [Burkholderia anthina]|uniref:hypothetical protein n=1 Tax=Burkholderia anthina TaxID=179879 RepID=UPI0012DABBB3|nr:hypothetical protein [Burkholderia anthina]
MQSDIHGDGIEKPCCDAPDETPQRKPLQLVLSHLFLDHARHRDDVHALRSQTCVAPPALDVACFQCAKSVIGPFNIYASRNRSTMTTTMRPAKFSAGCQNVVLVYHSRFATRGRSQCAISEYLDIRSLFKPLTRSGGEPQPTVGTPSPK